MQRRVRTTWPVLAGTIVVTAAALSCTGEVTTHTSDADTGSAQAFVSIERTARAQEPFDTRAEAFAGVLQTPPEVDPALVLKLTGLTRDLPPEGLCSDGRDRAAARLAPLSKVELLEIGSLAIDAGTLTTLAPRAFPTVTDLVSGVVYTTRDRDAERLPAAAEYKVTANGGTAADFSARATAPSELENVTVDGIPLGDLVSLSPRAALSVSWLAGEPRDLVYVELTAEGQSALLCAFRDEVGAAVIPAGYVPGNGSGTFGVHRLRTVEFQADGLARAELRFDFEVEAEVSFQ